MAVMLAGVELPGTQKIKTEEERAIVEHRVPGMNGSVLQDLGRGATITFVEGIFHGKEALDELQQRRKAFKAGKPVPFTADIISGTEIVDVLIEDFRVWQAAGYKDRYIYSLKLREYVTPSAPEFELGPVEEGIASDAEAWSEDVVAAAGVLQQPKSLAELLAERPDLLTHVSMEELAATIAKNAEGLTGSDLREILNALGKQDVKKPVELMDKIKEEDLSDIVKHTVNVELLDENGLTVTDVKVVFVDQYGLEWEAKLVDGVPQLDTLPPGKYTLLIDNIVS